MGEGLITISSSVSPDFFPTVTLGQYAVGAADGYHGQIASQSDLMLNGWPGIRASIKSSGLPDNQMVAYRVGDRLLAVSFVKVEEATIERVLKSIAFATRYGAGKMKQVGPMWQRAELKPFHYSVELPGEPVPQEVRLPELVNPLRRLMCVYGNRSYFVTYNSLGPNAFASEEERKESLIDSGDEAVRSAAAKFVKRTPGSLDGSPSQRVEATLQDGNLTFFTEATIVDDKLIILTATIPTALKDSPEVARFFSSFKLR